MVEVRMFTYAYVSMITPCTRLPQWTNRCIPTHHKPSAGMLGPEGPAHGLDWHGDGYPLNTSQ